MPPAEAGARRAFRWVVSAAAVAVLVLAGLLLTRHGSQAAGCDTWVGGVDGNFGTAGNWSTGLVPTSADDACITATTTTMPAAVADTYTVLLSGSRTVRSLTLGGPNGTQTLVIQSTTTVVTLGAASTVNANGVLTLGDANFGEAAVGSASVTLTNTGHLNTVQGGGGGRDLGNVTNAAGGAIDIGAAVTRQSGATTINSGTITIEAAGGLALGGGSSFANNGGSVTNNGAFSMTGGTFTERVGTESGNPVVLSGTTLDDDTSAGAARFTFRGCTVCGPGSPVDTLTGSGAQPGVAASQVVTVNGIDGGAALTLPISLTNAGTINLDNTSGGASEAAVGSASVTLTNTGHLNTVQGGGGGRDLGNVTNGPGGTIDIGAAVTRQSGATTINNGTVTIEAAGGLALGGGSSFTQGAAGTFATTINANTTTFGQLTGGLVTLNGTLSVTRIGKPAVGSSWPIISGANRSGMFATLAFGAFNYMTQYPATGVTLVAQASCDLWLGGVNTDFGTAGNWSFGTVPTSADDACITATTTTNPPAVADTYTVVASGGPSVHSLTLGGPNGTQTLVLASGAQLTLGAASTINTHGILTLGDAGGALTVLGGAGSLTNAGHLNTVQGGGGTRYLRLNITNAPAGTIDLAATSTFQDTATTTTNKGTVTVEATGGVGLFGGATFVNSGGTLSNNGAFSLNGSTFIQRGGTESGAAIFFANGSTLDDDLAGGPGGFTFLNSTDTLTGTGVAPGVAAGQVLTIGAGNGTQATLGVNLTNAGTIVMGDAGAGFSILCCAPNTLTNIGHLNTIQGGGGTRYLRANLVNASAGAMDVAAASTFQDGANGATTTTNNGAVTIEASGGFGLFGPGSFVNGGGAITNHGAFSANGNATFVERAGTETGTPVFFNNNSTLDDDVGGGAGLFTFLNGGATLTGTGASPGVAAGQVVTIGAGTGTQVTLAVNLTNAGTIAMGDAGGGYSILCCAAHTLTNAGHLDTIQGGGGTRYLRANLLNAAAGAIDVAAASTFQDGAGGATTTTNTGTVTIEAGGGLGVFGPGSFVNGGGAITNHGAFSVNGGATFTQRGGTESGTAVYIQSGSTLDDDLSAGAAQFVLSCPGCVAHLTGTGSAPGVAAGQLLTIPADATEVDLGANFTNAGTVVLGDAGTSISILCGKGVTLTNTGRLNTIKGRAVASNINRYLRLNITNAAGGSIDIAFRTFSEGVPCFGGSGTAATTITNNGTVTLEEGGLWLLSGGSGYTQTAGGLLATTIDVNNPSATGDMTGGPFNLDGKLKVTTIGTPALNSRWLIMHGTIGAGRFARFDRGGIGYQIDYTPTDIFVSVRPIRKYHPLPPARILDTRTPIGGHPTPLGPGASMSIPVTGVGGVPPDATAVIMNVTATDTTAASYLTVWPTGVLPRPLASNLNWTAGLTVPNLVEVAVGAGGMVSFYNAYGAADVVGDVAGYIGAPAVAPVPDGLFNPVVPDRVLDTRNGTGAPQAPVGPEQTITVSISGVPGSGIPPSGVAAVVLNVTATNPTAASYLTIYPTGATRPLASNLNFVAGQTVPNRVIVLLGSNGSVSIYNPSGSVDVVADVGGWFTDTTPDGVGSTFTGLTPARILDTRALSQIGPYSTPFGPNQTRNVVVAGQGLVPPMGTTAVIVNVTVTNATAPSYLTVWPDDASRPLASDLNYVAGQTVPNLVVVRLGADGSIFVYNASGAADVVIDVVGYSS